MFRRFSSVLFLVLLWAPVAGVTEAQVSKQESRDRATSGVQQGVTLADRGRCAEALPFLKGALSLPNRELKRSGGLAAVRCALALDKRDQALEYLRMLQREFPHDPDVLYVLVHAFSDLSTRASQDLARTASSSYQAHELNAEALEIQGKWDQAEKEYQWVLERNPRLPGIHYRLGRLLLSKPNPGPSMAEDAKREFQQELEIDPTNAGAEYVLGELARHDQHWEDAVAHFSRAAKLDAGFGDAFLGLGTSLISAKRYSEAITPLETAVKLQPQNPSAHYAIATAYSRAGRKQDAAKEFAIHRQMTNNSGSSGQPQQETEPANPN